MPLSEHSKEDLLVTQGSIHKAFDALSSESPGAREDLVLHLKQALHLIETPSEFCMRTAFTTPATSMCIHVCLDLGVIQHLAASTSATRTVSLQELNTAAKADGELLARLLKHLAAAFVIDEAGHESYRANRLTRDLAIPTVGNGIIGVTQTSGASFLHMADYLREIGYKNPTNVGDNGPFQFANHTKLNIYEWMVQENPRAGAAFMSYMVGNRTCANHWTEADFYPVLEQLSHPGLNHEIPLIVDVGGGMGQDMMLAATVCKDLPGHIIVQDTASVIDQTASSGLALPSRIELESHNFFLPQPESRRGARAYHMHHILHCWDEDRCIQILKNVRDAFQPGFSKLLVFEDVMPDVGADWKMTSMDLLMMAENGTTERTERQWNTLMHKAGLRIEKVWTKNAFTESLIEVGLAT